MFGLPVVPVAAQKRVAYVRAVGFRFVLLLATGDGFPVVDVACGLPVDGVAHGGVATGQVPADFKIGFQREIAVADAVDASGEQYCPPGAAPVSGGRRRRSGRRKNPHGCHPWDVGELVGTHGWIRLRRNYRVWYLEWGAVHARPGRPPEGDPGAPGFRGCGGA